MSKHCVIRVNFDPVIDIDENGNWFAYCEDLPSVFSTGATKQEALDGLIDCIKTYINTSLAYGYVIPQNDNFSLTIEMEEDNPKFIFLTNKDKNLAQSHV